METDKQQELKRILVEMENYRRRLEAISGQSKLVEGSIQELNSTINALNSLKESNPGTEILVPLGSDSFIRAELKDTERVITGIGGGVSVENRIEDAKKFLEKRREKMNRDMEKLQKTATETNRRLVELNSRYETLIREIQKE